MGPRQRICFYLNISDGEPNWITELFSLEYMQDFSREINGVDVSAIAAGIEIPDNLNPLRLRHIEAIEKNKGGGTRILKQIVEAADRYRRPLELSAYPYYERQENPDGKASKESIIRLVRFYERFGFEPKSTNYSWPVPMVRMPKS